MTYVANFEMLTHVPLCNWWIMAKKILHSYLN